MKPSAVIFDFDGVVVDSFDMHKNAWIAAYNELFSSVFPVVDPEKLTGKSSRQIASHICEAAGITSGIDELFHLKTKKIVDGVQKPSLLPGVRSIMDTIREMSIPYAVASNAPLEYLTSVLEYYEIEVPVVLGFEQVVNPKPAPDLFILAAEKLGVKSSEFESVIVFEDSAPGLNAADSAGMAPVGIRARFSDSEMYKAGAIEIFNSLEEVIDSGFFS